MKSLDRLSVLVIAGLLVWNAVFTVRQTRLSVGYTTALQSSQAQAVQAQQAAIQAQQEALKAVQAEQNELKIDEQQQSALKSAAAVIQYLESELDAADSKIQELGSPPPTT